MKANAVVHERNAHAPFRWWEALSDFYGEHCKSVFFSVALAVILDKLGVLTVLSKLSLTIVANLTAQGDGAPVAVQPGSPAVVVISQADFHERYGEKSPLDHCLLAQDIGNVLAKNPRVLGIDIDLSPVARPSATESACQARLDRVLDEQASRLVLMVPFATPSETLQQAKHGWMLDRCSKGIAFGDGTLDTSMGLVTDYADGPDPLLRARLAEQLAEGRSNEICRSATAAPDASANPWLRPEQRPDASGDAETSALNFAAVRRVLPVVDIRGESFSRISSLAGSAVLFGVDSSDDSFLTAIGRKSGVVVHGAKLVSFEHPVHSLPLLGAVFDAVIALCFAWVVHGFWHHYVGLRRRDWEVGVTGSGIRRRSGLSMLWTLGFLVLFALLAMFFVLAGMLLFSWGIAVAPLLIALSMLLDGFVGGPIDQLQQFIEQSEESGDERHGWAAERRPQLLLLLAGTAIGVVGCAIAGIAASTIAGWLFVLVVAAYLLATGYMLFFKCGLRHALAALHADFQELRVTTSFLFRRHVPRWDRVGAVAALLRAAAFWGVLGRAGFLLLPR